MNQFQYYAVRTRHILMSFLVVLLPVFVITLILQLINISGLKKELRNTTAINVLVEKTITEQAAEIEKLDRNFEENQDDILLLSPDTNENSES